MGRSSEMKSPGGNRHRMTVRMASRLSSGHGDGLMALAKVTRPAESTVNWTTTVPVWPLRRASAG